LTQEHAVTTRLGVLLFALIPAACGSSANYCRSCVSYPGAGAVLSATPSAYTFPLDDNTPEPIIVTRSSGSFASLTLSVADPTIVGVTTPTLGGATAKFSILPIARGSTVVTATDASSVSTTVHVTTALCGRPASLLAAQQVLPPSGASGVSPSIGTLYFVAYFPIGTSGIVPGNLHLIAGQHGTLEGSAYAAALLPPGSALPTPIPIPASSAIVSATVPMLAPGQTYQTQLFSDTCQPAVLAGSFST
jgi:hypothetical protein